MMDKALKGMHCAESCEQRCIMQKMATYPGATCIEGTKDIWHQQHVQQQVANNPPHKLPQQLLTNSTRILITRIWSL